MGKVLVIAEKPSVGRDIARVLGCREKGDGLLAGGNYIVSRSEERRVGKECRV